ALGWLERHGRFLAARRAVRGRFHALAHAAGHRPVRPLGFAALATLGLVLEVLVGEELLFPRRPDELRAAVHARKNPVLELHRSLPRRGSVYSDSRRSFLRFRFRASACLARLLSPGFR